MGTVVPVLANKHTHSPTKRSRIVMFKAIAGVSATVLVLNAQRILNEKDPRKIGRDNIDPNAVCNRNHGTFREESKVYLPSEMCTKCDVCGAEQIGGVLKEAQDWCERTNGEICRGGCSCPEAMLRHNITKLQNGQIVTVETCISSPTCLEIINGAKCPYPQIWRDQAPLCIRTCANKDGENQITCPQAWIPRCVCPQDRPIFHLDKCIKYDDCPATEQVKEIIDLKEETQ